MSYVGAEGDTEPKEAKEGVETGPEEDVPMLRADVRDAAIEIVNQIGPDAFLVLSAASRNMRNFCLNTAGIKIDWNKGGLGVKKTKEGVTQFVFFPEENSVRVNWEDEPAPKSAKPSTDNLENLMPWMRYFMNYRPNRVNVEKLRTMPFIIHISRLILDKVTVDAPLLEEIENYLIGIPIKTIREVECENVECWPELLKLMAKYKVKDLKVGSDSALSDAVLKQIVALKVSGRRHSPSPNSRSGIFGSNWMRPTSAPSSPTTSCWTLATAGLCRRGVPSSSLRVTLPILPTTQRA